MITQSTRERRCAVYLHYDADDVLLYVGITEGVHGRAKKHAYEAAWPQFASYGTFVWCMHREEAKERERELIHAMRPIFNCTYAVPGQERRVRAYLASKGRLDLLQPVRRRETSRPASRAVTPAAESPAAVSITVIDGLCWHQSQTGRFFSHQPRTPCVA
ncbi:hypothetical protein ABT369_39195 [Dactylosporangium sp. NPDC000244]|uniref:hypothetical protein n=1 Tax=Dactylosporangium sp. NPDC000244 TaxID=3154365 RepID=UPI003323494B